MILPVADLDFCLGGENIWRIELKGFWIPPGTDKLSLSAWFSPPLGIDVLPLWETQGKRHDEWGSAILKQQQLIKFGHGDGEICNVDKGSVNIHNRSTSHASFVINKSVGPICKLDNNLIISAKEVSTQTAAFSPTGSNYDTTIMITINDSAN